ncbi:glycosyltransferase [Cylindrospermopsis raciborskii]|uniref:glycosyltransferase n=1 Tax=Cylindrospermopsis raciborskii TaxID=77022 RepID=UPI000B608DF9|nr:family 2 glycosyl transferase [Raphidiopsis curvata NIES-932]
MRNESSFAPLISIIIPAREADIELRRCIDSVRIACPDHGKCQVIVVLPVTEIDKASLLLPEEYVITERKPGIYSAMNNGVSASSGRYLYFLGKDDIVLPRFSEALDLLESKSPDSLFFDVFWGVKGLVRGNPSRWRIILENICHQGIIYSREVLLIHGPYLTKMHVKADHLLNIRLLWDRVYSFQVEYMSLPLVWYSGTGFSSVNTDSSFWHLYPLILQKYVGKWAACLLIAYRKLRTLLPLLPDR